MSLAAACAPSRSTLRESESGGCRDTVSEAKGTSDKVLPGLRCSQNEDGCEARDEGRSLDYEAEERNDADAAFCRNPEGRGSSGGLRCRSACQGG